MSPPPGAGRAVAGTLVLAVLVACDAGSPREAAPPAADAAVVDAAGREHPTGGPHPRRIVSLVPSATETLLALGVADALVGRTDYDEDPGVAALPSVGGGLQPNLEALLALEPDLVVRFAGPSDPDTPERLDDAGVRHLAVRPDGVDDVKRMIRDLGAVVGRDEAARDLVTDIEARLAEVRARVAGRDPARVAYLFGGSPPWVAGPGTFIHELIEAAGGVNVFDDVGDLYAPVSVEDLLARDVDIFVVAPGTRLDPRVQAGRPVRAAPPGLETPGPDVAAAATAMGRLLHPDAWP